MIQWCRKVSLLLCALLVGLCLSGCTGHNYNEPEDLQFAAGMAIDRLPDGRMQVTVEVETAGGTEEVGSKAEHFVLVGNSVVEALSSNLMMTDKSLYWTQMDLTIVSEEVAQKHMTEVVDTILRMYNMNMDMTVVVSKMPTAQEALMLLKVNRGDQVSSELVVDSLDLQRHLGKAPTVHLYEFADDTQDEGRSAFLPVVQAYDQDPTTLKVAGAAVFNRIWLAGYLDEDETRAMLLLLKKLEVTYYSLPPSPTGAYSNASVEIMPTKMSIVPTVTDGKLTVDIRMWVDMTLTSINGASDDDTHQKAIREDLVRNTAMMLERDVYSLLEKTKTMNSADVLGLGASYKDKHSRQWKQISHTWRDLYRNMDVHVAAQVKLRNTGLIQEPAIYGD